jgi:metal-dependent amidase/aminoacylase/carboxypeptidase family protein
MYRGLLDGVDMAFMIHTGTDAPNTGRITGGNNGCIAKKVTFQGVSAHAGGSPHSGVNALYAANNALSMINALRETFRDGDHIRVHPVITAGGGSVNAIPDCVKLESFVRGATMEAIVDANRKVNRAIAAAAAGMGAKVRLWDVPGYWPRSSSVPAMELMKQAMEQVMENVTYKPKFWGGGCTDLGDICAVMPALHPYIGGAEGKGHGNDYRITDPDTACVKSAQVQLMYLAMLLRNDGAEAKKIIEEYQPYFASMQDYFAYMDKLNIDKEAVTYGEGNDISISF